MDDGRGKAERQDDGEFDPAWPKRPETGQSNGARPRLDPPLMPRNNAGQSGTPGRADENVQTPPSKWTSHPTSHNRQGYSLDDPQSTRVLPVVEGPSRFENGRAGDEGRRTRDEGRQNQVPPQVRAQKGAAQGGSKVQPWQPEQSSDTRAGQAASQPQQSRASQWGYERDEQGFDEDDYDSYADRTLPYTQQQWPPRRPQSQAQAPALGTTGLPERPR